MLKRKKYDYDLIVIGSGAGGSVGAHHAVSLGKKVALFEKDKIGGECPNWACVPTKALLYSAEVYDKAKDSQAYGIEVEKPNINWEKIKKWKDLVVSRTGAAHGEQLLKEEGIHLIKAKAKFINQNQVEADGKVYSASKFLIATGSSVFIPPIEGLEEAGFVTFKEAIDFNNLPKSLFILGGGPIGCEFAQIFSSLGVKIILADNVERLLAKEDAEVSELVQALFEYRGIKVLTGVNVHKIEVKSGKKIIHYIDKKDTHRSAEVEEILIATGKRPVLDFDPEKAGLEINGGHLKVDKFLQTNVSNIYAAGDLVGPYLFTHTGYYQSYLAINNAFTSKKESPDYSAIPKCVFTTPEVASVGLGEIQAKDMGVKIKVGITPIAVLGRANTSNEMDGFIKVITDKKERIIGASIVAPRAGEMIHELALAVKLKLKAKTLAEMIHAYPTFSEGIKIACSNLESK